jgi:hypothetical protein
LQKFLVSGFNISPAAAQLICSSQDPEAVIEEVCRKAKGISLIGEEEVLNAINSVSSRQIEVKRHEHEEKNRQRIRVLKEVRSSMVEERLRTSWRISTPGSRRYPEFCGTGFSKPRSETSEGSGAKL